MARPARDAVLDTCVLFPSTLRGVLLNSAAMGAFQPAWSERIIGELTANLAGKTSMQPGATRRLAADLRTQFPGAVVPNDAIRRLEPQMRNDPKDRHVLAAAVAVRAPVVVTTNLKDFQVADLRSVGVQAMHPDAFLSKLLTERPAILDRALSQQVQYMNLRRSTSGRHEVWTRGQLLGHLGGMGRSAGTAPQFAKRAEAALGIRASAPPDRDKASPPRSTARTLRIASAGLDRSATATRGRSI